MITIFANCHMCQQPRSRQTLLDRLHRLLCREHRAALRAGVFLTGFLDHIQRGRHVFESLTGLFADSLQLSLALGTFPFLFSEIVDHTPPLQGFRQASPAMALACGCFRFTLLWKREDFLSRADDPNGIQEQLIFIYSFALRPVPPAQQLLHHVLQLLETTLLGVQLLEQTRHHLPQGSWIFRQLVAINLHRSASPRPARPSPAPPPDPPTR